MKRSLDKKLGWLGLVLGVLSLTALATLVVVREVLV